MFLKWNDQSRNSKRRRGSHATTKQGFTSGRLRLERHMTADLLGAGSHILVAVEHAFCYWLKRDARNTHYDRWAQTQLLKHSSQTQLHITTKSLTTLSSK